jgi:hypothetical protein
VITLAERKMLQSEGDQNLPSKIIKTLKVELLSEDQKYVRVLPNYKQPTAFETEFFKGYSMIFLRTNPIEKHLETFFVGKYAIQIIQIYSIYIMFLTTLIKLTERDNLKYKSKANLNAYQTEKFTLELRQVVKWN